MNNNKDNFRNDFLLFQNEILKDIKQVETRLNEKIAQTTNFIDQQNENIELKFKELNSRFDLFSQQIEEKDTSPRLEQLLKDSKKKLEENISKVDIKVNLLEKDLDTACFKYDKMFSNNLIVPGLIGKLCPYDTLKSYLSYVNIKITELLKSKEKQIIDLKKYKEKLEAMIGQNKVQFDTIQNKLNN